MKYLLFWPVLIGVYFFAKWFFAKWYDPSPQKVDFDYLVLKEKARLGGSTPVTKVEKKEFKRYSDKVECLAINLFYPGERGVNWPPKIDQILHQKVFLNNEERMKIRSNWDDPAYFDFCQDLSSLMEPIVGGDGVDWAKKIFSGSESYKKQYFLLAKRYHPDTLIGKLGSEFNAPKVRQRLNENFNQIQKAYEILRMV